MSTGLGGRNRQRRKDRGGEHGAQTPPAAKATARPFRRFHIQSAVSDRLASLWAPGRGSCGDWSVENPHPPNYTKFQDFLTLRTMIREYMCQRLSGQAFFRDLALFKAAHRSTPEGSARRAGSRGRRPWPRRPWGRACRSSTRCRSRLPATGDRAACEMLTCHPPLRRKRTAKP